MTKNIVIIQGHPDPKGGHFDHMLGDTYARAAESAGHTVSTIHVANLEFPILRSKEDWNSGPVMKDIEVAQSLIRDADHLVLVYPLWLGSMPALVKGFLEQVLRPGFALENSSEGGFPKGKLKGKSARIIVTMGMPAFFYRLFYGSHSLKSLERNILRFCGIKPVKSTVIGLVEGISGVKCRQIKKNIAKLAAAAR
ncbi:dehydrogenase [Hahella sp. CCB-MM4]|uniref:NAD(P)H-dependent oxidoreductase n=1 Tax=Hahella sp. (strain CCB-MM4) TaxID=1926491 RepID=UPI000B9AB05A|nr:NAD(P)H-dependent oxidoreductase [Hahella sp. CCB-MM4]OZG74212.1 dehydrogenase [Hahella sp. CCB-MM4]